MWLWWKMIIINNEEALRVKCEDVLSDEIGNLILALETELNHANRLGKSGIGLAAPQIGIAKNIAIVRLGNGLNLDLVNAKIEKGYDSTMFRTEGCLSFPGRMEDTMRYQEIYLTNNLVSPHNLIATGLLAVVCQHEIDHLNSILFMDRAIPKVATNDVVKAGRNDLCPCGSFKKYKKCCGR